MPTNPNQPMIDALLAGIAQLDAVEASIDDQLDSIEAAKQTLTDNYNAQLAQVAAGVAQLQLQKAFYENFELSIRAQITALGG